jgi:hypothetical protein
MTRQLLLECKGLKLGTINIPAFQVLLGEVVAVVEPTESWDECINLMRVLSGRAAAQGVTVNCQVGILDPFLSFAQGEGIMDRPLPDLLRENGLTKSEAYEVIVAAGLQPNLTYRDAQLTNRLLLEIKVSLLRGVQLMVFSTAGLDPLGVDRVLTEARNCRTQCSSLALFHESLASYHESIGLFDRLCDRMLHISKRQSASATGDSA